MNLIPWEKLVYYQIFCFIWQKGQKQIGERGLNMTKNHLQFPVSVRLYCYLYPGAWPVALSHRNFSFSQAASQPCWAARATSFPPDVVDTSHQGDVGYGTCASAWGKRFLFQFCCVGVILQLNWLQTQTCIPYNHSGVLGPCSKLNLNLQNWSHGGWQTLV